MGQLNLYYRAFKNYRKYTLKDKACLRQRQRIVQASSEHDRLECIRTTCKIDEKWVEQIEKGLPFVEKAIAEERQFIKNEGEVLDIEKVKHVSKDSVAHLARHSDLITHVPKDGGDLIPDKIYMVERLSDYAVYENRFLYMLLCYVRDFIDLRLKKIKELGNRYFAQTYIKRDMQLANGKLFFEGKLVEENNRDPFATMDEKTVSVIDRIESCQHIVSSLLSKPLMVIVAKSPMLKPPITKTNVLKMDIKFKNAVSLYEYLSAYEGAGYDIIEKKKTFSPFGEELGDELSEIINLTSFITYEYGNELNGTLQREFDIEEKELAEKEKKKKLLQLEELKNKLKDGNINVEEYLLSLEQLLAEIKTENERLVQCEKEYTILKDKHEDLKAEKIELNKKLSETERESAEKSEQIIQLNEKHEEELQSAENRRLSDLENQAEEMTADFNLKTSLREKEYQDNIEQIKLKAEQEFNAYKTESENKFDTLQGEYDSLFTKKNLVSAELHAIKGKQGLLDQVDFNSEEKFGELEEEFLAFYDLFVDKWKDAKKQMRQEILWSKFKRLKKKIEQ